MAGFMDFLTGNQDSITGALGGLGSYYLSQENIKGAQASGEQARMLSEQAGQQARDYSTFKPYTVTSGLANVGTTAQGGFGVNLSPQQQAVQNQLMGQAQNLFGQVGQDPAAQQCRRTCLLVVVVVYRLLSTVAHQSSLRMRRHVKRLWRLLV
jgi:hypothetical protein